MGVGGGGSEESNLGSPFPEELWFCKKRKLTRNTTKHMGGSLRVSLQMTSSWVVSALNADGVPRDSAQLMSGNISSVSSLKKSKGLEARDCLKEKRAGQKQGKFSVSPSRAKGTRK